jgi:hypothetical protein
MEVHPLLTVGVTSARLGSTVAARWAATVHRALRGDGGRVTSRMVEPGAGSDYYLIRVRLVDGAPLRLLLNLAICTDGPFRHPQGRRFRCGGAHVGVAAARWRRGSGRDPDRTLWR